MKTFVGLFFSSTAFGLVILVAYWFVAHEETFGSMMLAVLTVGFALTAGYALLAERSAHIDGDGPDLTARDVRGEELGVFTTASAWPVVVAICVAVGLIGLLYAPVLGFAAGAGLVLALWRLGAESART